MDEVDSSIPLELAQLVTSNLDSNEKIVWAAQPIPLKMAGQSCGGVLFGIPWTAFAVWWTVGAYIAISKQKTTAVSYFFPLFGLPFIIFGIGMLSSPYWAARKARRTVYLITNRRAIIFESDIRNEVSIRSFEKNQLGNIVRTQNNDGSGDLILAQNWTITRKGQRVSNNIGFIAIRNVKEAEDRMRELADSADSKS